MSTKDTQLLNWLLLLIFLVDSVRSACNVCNSVNSMACYAVDQIQACDANNLPTRIPFNCPPGYVCVSGASGVLCRPTASGSIGDCQDCNKCDATNTFACTGTNSFALCLGTTTPQNSLGSCSPGYVCNNMNDQICGLETQFGPTCSYADDTTTTATPPTATPAPTPSTDNAATYCAAVKAPGNYAVGDYAETTCRQYIKCFLLNGVWRGQKYTCPGKTYFNPTTGLCAVSMPGNCYTPTGTTTTTTVAPTTSNPNAYCAKMQSQDYFPVGTNPSSTCRQYIYCHLLNGRWLGNMYTCPGNTYYNSSTKRCQTGLPATCTRAVARLSLNGVELI
ncbi:GH16136 [Drosophila grimshawi]|uniref:GH16136 n=2 Tax=Drosophila grimshawi TaxID=7222 RepID=B4J3M1_DROGR|nr:GH16136 [Drosophila grimshawi]